MRLKHTGCNQAPVHRQWVALLSMLVVAGCSSAPAAPTTDVEPLPETETWGAIFVNGKKIGHQHFKRTHAKSDSGTLVKVEHATKMKLLRFDTTAEIDVVQLATETADGTLVDFETRMKTGNGVNKTIGKVQDGKLWIRQGSQKDTSQPLAKGVGSFASLDHSLERDPLEPDEKRTILQVEPSFGGVVTVDLHAKDWESTELLSGEFKLLRVEGKMTMPNKTSLSIVLWTDSDGRTLKVTTPMGALTQTSYRTTKEVALAPAEGANFDIGRATTVPSDKALPGIHEKSHGRYRVRLKAPGKATDFSNSAGQSVKEIDSKTFEVTINAVRPSSESISNEERPTDEDRQPNHLIESDDEAIVAMAKKAAGDASGNWEVAKRLENYVHSAIKAKNFSNAFDSAANVAKSREGDCTEHSVLLAALARANDIPARVATGLVYMAGEQTFGLHMWTELWIDDRWIGMDATLGRGGLGAGHIKISHTSLAGPGAYSSLLPVLKLLGQMKVEVLEVK